MVSSESVRPAVMRAVELTGHGGYDCLRYRADRPVPAPEPGEVLVRIGAAGINNTDINMRVGWYSRAVDSGTATEAAQAGTGTADPADAGWTGSAYRFPRIQGADGCGTVVGLGPQVTGPPLGSRVLIEPIVRRQSDGLPVYDYVGSERDGAFAEYVAIPAANAHPIVSSWSDAELASIPCSYSAAEHMLSRATVASRDTVLITGASGGVGSAAVQLAARRGAKIIAVASRAKTAELLALGAAQVLDRDADLVRELSANSVDVVIDVVGGARFPHLIDVLRPFGRYATAGAIAGPVVKLDLRSVYLKDLRLEGCTIFPPQIFRDLIGYIERSEIRPVVAETYALADIVKAQQAFLEKRHTGKIVLIP